MAIRLRPNKIVDATLRCEHQKPAEDRIQWRLKVVTAGDLVDYHDAAHAAAVIGDDKERLAAMREVIRRIAVGWTNLVDENGATVAFDDAGLNGFTEMELWQIVWGLPDAMSVGEVDLKKSLSQSASNGAGSPAPVSADPAAGTSIPKSPAGGAAS